MKDNHLSLLKGLTITTYVLFLMLLRTWGLNSTVLNDTLLFSLLLIWVIKRGDPGIEPGPPASKAGIIPLEESPLTIYPNIKISLHYH